MKRKQEDAKQPAAAGDSPYLDSSLNTLAALRNVERKQRRKLGKALVQKLDATLPQHYSSQPTLNGAGGRSLGSKGRSLHDVLTDAIKVVQAARDGQAPAPAGAMHCTALSVQWAPITAHGRPLTVTLGMPHVAGVPNDCPLMFSTWPPAGLICRGNVVSTCGAS